MSKWDIGQLGDISHMVGAHPPSPAVTRRSPCHNSHRLAPLARLRQFNDATAFNGAIGGWDTSKIALMHATFQRASGFNADIGGWDMSKVADIGNQFHGARPSTWTSAAGT